MIKTRRRIRLAPENNYYLLEKQLGVFGIPITPWMSDFPEAIYGKGQAVKRLFCQMREDMKNAN